MGGAGEYNDFVDTAVSGAFDDIGRTADLSAVWVEDDSGNDDDSTPYYVIEPAFPRTLEEARRLWEELGRVPLNCDGRFLDEPFLHHETDTDIKEVWRWFEETFNVSVACDLMRLDTNA